MTQVIQTTTATAVKMSLFKIKNRISILSNWFAIITSRLLCQMLANLGPVYMEVGDPRKVR